MGINKDDMIMIQNLVGDITESNLKYVDCYISEHLGIFIPSVGFCEYAIKPNHTHPSYSFVLSFSKEQSIIKPDIQLKPNHYLMAALSPYIPHEEEKQDMFTRYIALLISTELFEKTYAWYSDHEPDQYIWKQFLVHNDIMLYFRKFMSEYESKISGYNIHLNALATLITHSVIRSMLKVRIKTDTFSDKLEIQNIIEYMQQNYSNKLTNTNLAKQVNMSESHFIRLFKNETGTTPIEYLVKLRIEKAKKLLKSNKKNITEVSLLCGFNSSSHFSSSFLKHEKISPSDYQNLYVSH